MKFFGVRTTVRRVAHRTRFLARLHPLIGPRFARAGNNCFITCSGKTDRAGAQALAVLSTMLFAERTGMHYVHTPFRYIAHHPPVPGQAPDHSALELADRWERFFNLGAGERCIDETESLPLVRVSLQSASELPFGRDHILYVVPDSHAYANAFPNQYLRIIGRFSQKYRSTPKEDLQSYYDPSRLNIAVHVRRGDVAAYNKHSSRYTANSQIASRVRDVTAAAVGSARPPAVHLYSEGSLEDFGELRDMDINFHLDECPFATFNNLVSADVLMMSKSTFSYVAALLSRGVKVYESFQGTFLNHKPLGHWLVADADGRVDPHQFRRALKERGVTNPKLPAF